jgi:serine/threonine-protein kinase PpkA
MSARPLIRFSPPQTSRAFRTFWAPPLWALLLIVGFGVASALAGICDGIQCSAGNGSCIVSDSGLPLRLLVKPDANLHENADEKSNVIQGNLSPFSVMYAYEMLNCDKDSADPFSTPVWYKVGFTAADTAGYMSGNAVVQWRNGMSLAYTNPGASERRRAIMFDEWTSLESFVSNVTSGKIDVAKTYEKILDRSEIPTGVRAVEQENWVDIDRKVYLLPILQFEDMAQYYPEGDFRALQIASLSKASSGRSAGGSAAGQCDLQKEDSGEKCVAEHRTGEVGAIDIVWVIDMTLSMQPYIDAVKHAVADATTSINNSAGEEADKVRFGLVGYRDDVEESPWLEFVTKNFTPELLSQKEFSALMADGNIKAADKSTGDFPEEVFAGVREGARSAWREKSLKVIILIGDASSHPLGHPKNTSNLSEDAVKAELNTQKIYASAILISSHDASGDSEIAEKQFSVLSEVDGSSAFHRVETEKSGAGGDQLALAMKQTVSQVLDFAASGDISKIGSSGSDDGAGGAVKKAIRAAVVDYLGQEAEPPSNITAWVADRDLGALDKQTFETRVVMTRKDVQELQQLIKSLLTAVRSGSKSDSGFMGDLQGGSAAAAMDLNIEGSQKFKESGLVPKWVSTLPYKSQILSYSLEEFLQLPPDDRTKIEERLSELTNVYDTILQDADAWYQLNEKDVETGQVHLLALRLLP